MSRYFVSSLLPHKWASHTEIPAGITFHKLHRITDILDMNSAFDDVKYEFEYVSILWCHMVSFHIRIHPGCQISWICTRNHHHCVQHPLWYHTSQILSFKPLLLKLAYVDMLSIRQLNWNAGIVSHLKNKKNIHK